MEIAFAPARFSRAFRLHSRSFCRFHRCRCSNAVIQVGENKGQVLPFANTLDPHIKSEERGRLTSVNFLFTV